MTRDGTARRRSTVAAAGAVRGQCRVCPVPANPAAESENPCPDPDVTGPVAALDALYPIGGA